MRNRCIGSFCLCIVASWVVLLSACIPYSIDNSEVGDFCVGESNCSGYVELSRESSGRSRVDFTVRNKTDKAIQVTVDVAIPDPQKGELVKLPVDKSRRIATRTFTVSAKSWAGDRFSALEIGTRRDILLTLSCEGCEATVSYVLGTEPLECRKTNECSGGWKCDGGRGICVECVANEDCNPEQTCGVSGRCSPGDREASCGMVGGTQPLGYYVVCVAGVFVFRRFTFLGRRAL